MTKLPYNRGLSWILLRNIRKRKYTVEQIAQMHAALKKQQADKNTGFIRAAITLAVCVLIVMIFSIISDSGQGLPVIPLLGALAASACIVLLYLRVNFADKEKRQFSHALEKGYPELVEKYGRDSFQS